MIIINESLPLHWYVLKKKQSFNQHNLIYITWILRLSQIMWAMITKTFIIGVDIFLMILSLLFMDYLKIHYNNNSATWLCSILYLAPNMGIHYLIFIGRNLKKRRKLMPIRIMKSVGLNSKNIVNSVGIFNVSAASNNNFVE